MSPRRGRLASELVTIFWRDIPAQVTGRHGEDKVAIELPPRFMNAIDRAAVVADLVKYDQYIGEWRREAVPFDGGALERAAQAAVAQLEHDYPPARIAGMVANGGFAVSESEEGS